MAAANGLIALGTAVLSAGGLVEGAVGHDEAFVLSLALGISVIYTGFLVAGVRARADQVARACAAAPTHPGRPDPGPAPVVSP
jgi:hypothetical protein